MLAAWYERNGVACDVLQVGELACPEPAAGEVRIKLYASGVNPSDVKSRKTRPLAGPKVIPHSDGAGVIEAVGAGIDAGRIGERVWTWNAQWQRAYGTAAEAIVLPSEQAVELPDHCSFEVGACIGIPVLTAIHALSLLGDIRGKTLLVTGAATAVGHYVSQIAVGDKGARVIGTVGSESKAAHAAAVGVSDTINYKTENVAERLLALTNGEGVDGVIDMDFSTTAPLASTGAIANHATIVSYGSNKSDEVAIPYREFLFRCLSLRQFAIYVITAEQREYVLSEAQRLLASNVLKHTIASRFPLAQIVAAHEAVETGNNGSFGNIVITLT
jgi:NADPH2:quinone reductase